MSKELSEVLYETAKDLHRIGLVDNQAIREFETLCAELAVSCRNETQETIEIELAEAIKKIRK